MIQYETPRITDYGDVRHLTAGRNNRLLTDVTIPTGNPHLQETTGPCILPNGGGPLPCTPP
jgi:hypothetical protein